MEHRNDRYTSLEERYAGCDVFGPGNERIGRVDELFLDEDDVLEYIGVKTGAADSRTTLIPVEIATMDEERGRVEVPTATGGAPAFDDEREITPEDEAEVRSFYGLSPLGSSSGRGSYDDHRSDEHIVEGDHAEEERREREKKFGEVGPGMAMGDTESGRFRGHSAEHEGVRQPGSDLEDEDELRVSRSEEELHAGTREREAGSMRVRKRVRTDHERMVVPKKREQVSVERVPMGGEASPGEIGGDEVSMPVVEEEVFVEKRAVKKEEIRVRKDVVDEEEIVEEDLRKEEVEVEDDTERGQGLR